MSAEFVSLAELLRAAAAASAASILSPRVPGEPRTAEEDATPSDSAAASPLDSVGVGSHDAVNGVSLHSAGAASLNVGGDPAAESGDALGGALRDARLFRARLADAFDDAVARLVRELAADVLARELRLAPVEIAALAQRVLARAPVIRIRVAPADVGFVRGVPVLADPSLAPGDAIVELGRGELDARLGVRLAAVLEAFA